MTILGRCELRRKIEALVNDDRYEPIRAWLP
jgi:hypothetical protein